MVALGGVEVFGLADVELDLDRIDLRDRGHDGGRAGQRADLRLGNARDAGDRRRHLGPAVVELRLRKGGARRFDRRRGLPFGGEVVVELLRGDHLRGDQLPIALHVELRLRQGSRVPVQGGPRLVGHRLVIARVDQEHQLALPDVCTLPIHLLADVSLDLGFDVRIDESVQAPHPLAIDGHVLLQHVGDLHCGGRRGRGRRRLAASGVCEQGNEYQGSFPLVHRARTVHVACRSERPATAHAADTRCRTAGHFCTATRQKLTRLPPRSAGSGKGGAGIEPL